MIQKSFVVFFLYSYIWLSKTSHEMKVNKNAVHMSELSKKLMCKSYLNTTIKTVSFSY